MSIANVSSNIDNMQEKLVSVNRTAKVVKGGRRFRFSVVVVIGDKKGRIGYGLGKALEVPAAIQKAIERAKKNLMALYSLKKTAMDLVSFSWVKIGSTKYMKQQV